MPLSVRMNFWPTLTKRRRRRNWYVLTLIYFCINVEINQTVFLVYSSKAYHFSPTDFGCISRNHSAGEGRTLFFFFGKDYRYNLTKFVCNPEPIQLVKEEWRRLSTRHKDKQNFLTCGSVILCSKPPKSVSLM